MAYISSDVTRKALAGITPTEHRYEGYGEGIYSAGFSRLTYDALYENARQHLRAGKSVVIDATFSRRQERVHAMDVARELGVKAWFIECVTSEGESRLRLVRRTESGEETASDGRWELFQNQKESWEPVGEEVATGDYIRLNTTGPREDNVRKILKLLFASAVAKVRVIP